jgi:hypothetical protein
MLRVFKPSSPMSLGTWCITIYVLLLTVLVLLSRVPGRPAHSLLAFFSRRRRRDAWADRVTLDWRGLVLFSEYFQGDTGRGLSASHQTGWTVLITRLLEDCARRREQKQETRSVGR